MKDRVLDTTDVLINRKPIGDGLAVERGCIQLCIGIPIEIPGGIDKGVHGVGLAARGTSAFGTLRLDEFLQAGQR